MKPIVLPESLVAQLRAYEARLRKMETLAAAAGGLVGILASFVLLFVLDRFGATPRAARFVLTLSGGALAAWFAHGWAAHWLWERRGPAQLARLLQRHFKTLGDRLQGIIELTGSDDLPANVSPGLMRAAIRQVAEESGRFDFAQAVPVRLARSWALAAIVLVALSAAPFVFVPRAATNALLRWLAPWAEIERYTFASLEALPAELVVPHGEPFEIACGLQPDSAWRPAAATAQLNDAEPLKVRLQDGRAVFPLAGQTRNGVLRVRVGDAAREIAIRPLHRPEMKEFAARVELPGYLGYPETNVPIQGSSAEFLEGSSVRFAGKTSRALGGAAMKSGRAEPPAELLGESFLTAAQPIEDLASEATFRWADTHGLTPTQPYTVRLSTTKDAEPRVELHGLEQEAAILPHEVLTLKFTATDDFGLRHAWLGWTVRALGEKKTELGTGEAARQNGASTRRELGAETEFAPAWQKIPEDSVVELAAYAVDYLPDRRPVASMKYTVHVLSPAKHAERVRERMELVLKQLDERIRDEERQLEETTAIAEDKPNLASERVGERLKNVAAGERSNAAQIAKLTDEMREVMKDALRNPEVPEGTLADWQNLTDRLEQQAAPPMQSAAQTLQQAAPQPAERETATAAAREQQEAALEAMRKIAKTMNTTTENLSARNFYTRMRAAAAAEHQIAEGLKSLAKETVGLRPEEIAPGEKDDFIQVANRQERTVKEIDSLATDLTGFVRRVPNEKYEAVQNQLAQKKTVAQLTELAGFVRANLGLKSVGRARQWGVQFDEWATMLQSECNCQGGGGEMDPEQLELIVAMVRAAHAQEGIRARTEMLESRKEANPQHVNAASQLAGQQEELKTSVAALREKTKLEKFKPTLAKVEEVMSEVAGHLRAPKTDAEVLAAQGAIIELLVPPDKKGGQGDSKMEQMMQKMMAQTSAARSGGGNNSKSAASLRGSAAEGAMGQDRSGARAVEKTGAASSAGEWPEEFRDQLQAYFQQLETAR